MASDIKFNIYHSLSDNGPWTLASPTPISFSEDGEQSTTVSGLAAGTYYYMRIIGGRVEDETFIPLMSQIIGTSVAGGTTDFSSLYIDPPLEFQTASGLDLG